jgi:hypothetical protein
MSSCEHGSRGQEGTLEASVIPLLLLLPEADVHAIMRCIVHIEGCAMLMDVL